VSLGGCFCWGCAGGGRVCSHSVLRGRAQQANPSHALELAEFGGVVVDVVADYLKDEFGVTDQILAKMLNHFKRKISR